MRKRNVIRLTESQLNRVIANSVKRCLKEGQGLRMAMDGVRSAFTGKDPHGRDIYPLPSNVGDDFEQEMDDRIADDNLGMDYYDDFGGPSMNPEDHPVDNSSFGKFGRKAGMKFGDAARMMGGKVRDWFGGNGTNGEPFAPIPAEDEDMPEDMDDDFSDEEDYDDEMAMRESRRRLGRRMNENYGRRISRRRY